jgi:Domain of unknown function (DUF5667)
MNRSNRLHDELDVLLDGRLGEVSEDLAPLLQAADELRAELAAFELDPEVADRHLERLLSGEAPAAVVPLPTRRAPGDRWRRRVAAVVLAAALLLAPATIASASSLPGDTLYPVKIAVEKIRLATAMWSSTREAGERTRVADERLEELNRLVELSRFSQVPPAIRALNHAVVAAQVAVREAINEEGTDGSEVAEVAGKLAEVTVARQVELTALVALVDELPQTVLPPGTVEEIVLAVEQAGVKVQESTTSPPANPPATKPEPEPPATSSPSDSPQTTNAPPPATEPPAPETTSPPPPDPTTTTTPPPPPTTVVPSDAGGGSDTGKSEDQPQDTTGP